MIPHRELRNNSGSILARVAAGESFAVTNHGAILSPPATSTTERLLHAGALRPPKNPDVDFASLGRASEVSIREIVDDLRGER